MNGFHFGFKDKRLSELVHLRMSSELFKSLKEEADRKGSDLSQTIRELLEEQILKKNVCIGIREDTKVQENSVCSEI